MTTAVDFVAQSLLSLQDKVMWEVAMDTPSQVGDSPDDEQDEPLGPREAAYLLERTRREAQHRLSSDTPVLSVLSALVVLAVYGSIWSSSRGHDPYEGPSLTVIGVVYIVVAAAVLVSVAVYVRATSGVSGRSRLEARWLAVPVAFAVVGVYVFDGALRYDGFSAAIVYGVFDAAAPWLVLGAVMAGYAAGRQDRWKLIGGLSMVVVGTGSAFAGPADAWGVLAVGGCLLLLAQAVLRFRWHRTGILPSSPATAGSRTT